MWGKNCSRCNHLLKNKLQQWTNEDFPPPITVPFASHLSSFIFVSLAPEYCCVVWELMFPPEHWFLCSSVARSSDQENLLQSLCKTWVSNSGTWAKFGHAVSLYLACCYHTAHVAPIRQIPACSAGILAASIKIGRWLKDLNIMTSLFFFFSLALPVPLFHCLSLRHFGLTLYLSVTPLVFQGFENSTVLLTNWWQVVLNAPYKKNQQVQ